MPTLTYKLVLSRDEILYSWHRIKEQNMAWAYAYMCEQNALTDEEVLHIYDNKLVLPFGFYVDNQLAGFAEVSAYNLQSRAIKVSPCLWREYFQLGKDLFIGGSLFCVEKLDGSCCVGKTPVVNRHMINLLDSIGYQRIGYIPEACWFARKRKFAGCVVSIATRQSLLRAKKQLDKA
ncbi:MAG: hypothetical protein LIP10_02565 [Clostridiales bacterium]|nr:hypothetical protein [Clostridiales bacterium]